MEKLDENFGKSEDIIANNIEQLKQLFPEAFTDGRINFEVLKQLLGEYIDTNEEKYGLNWFGKKKARQFALTPSLGTLRPCPEKSVDWDTTKNMIISGDNLEVLKLLQKSYTGKIKLIYIDPPYNTGKEFVYNDDYVDNLKNYLEITNQTEDSAKLSSNSETGGRYHTNWMNMLYPRLVLARNLLGSDGFIFISIDDNELHNLRLLCNELFGEENFVACIVWETRFNPISMSKTISDVHEYIVVYAKNNAVAQINYLPRTEKQDNRYSNPDNDVRGDWASDNLTAGPAVASRVYDVETPSGRIVRPSEGLCWIFTKERFDEMVADNRITFGLDGSNFPRLKRFLSEVKQGVVPTTIWTYKDAGSTQKSTRELKEIFDGKKVFDYPKPVDLMKRIITIGSKDEDIVLDFFAGSGSTGHAVLQQNAEDGFNRRFILVQLPEPCQIGSEAYSLGYRTLTDVCVDRISRVSNQMKTNTTSCYNDLGYRLFNLDYSNIKAWDPSASDIERSIEEITEYIKSDRSEQDILFELLLKFGLDLAVQIESRDIANKQVYNVGYGVLLVCLAANINNTEIEPLAHGMIEWIKEQNPEAETTVVFRDSAFADDIAKTNITAIFNQYGFLNIRSL